MAEPTQPAAGAAAPRAGAPPATSSAAAPGPGPDEAQAWAEVEARWAEPAVHQAYLARFPDLDGLAAAGRRYRDALAARPADAVALAMKAEILKRATVVGLAMLPRTPPSAPDTGRWRRLAWRLLAAWLGFTLAWLLWKAATGLSR